MKHLARLSLVLGCLILAPFATPAAQAGYVGSETLTASSVTSSTGTLSANSVFTFSFVGTANSLGIGSNSGAFTVIPTSTFQNGVVYTTGVLDLANLPAFSISNATYGGFQAMSNDGNGFTSQVTTSTPSFVNIYLIGHYANLPGNMDSTEASLVISLNQSAGGLISAAFSLSVQPAAVPEPASVALLGMGLFGVGGFALRHHRSR